MDAERVTRLELNDVSLSVRTDDGDRLLAEKLKLRLRANAMIAINGASGSGKSTLLRAVIRMHPCSSGEVSFDGKPISSYHPPMLRRQIVYLRQFPVFSPGTAKENLLEAGMWKANKPIQIDSQTLGERVRELGLDASMLQQEVSKLSGGEAQRVALLRALLLDPEILLLDETTANLDPDHDQAIVEIVKRWVASDAHAAIWVTHSRDLLRRLNVESYRLTQTGFEREDIA